MPAALCAFCNHANAAGSKFCSECGAALRLTLCPECEAVNDRTRTHCYKCGADLDASAIFAQAAETTHTVAEERAGSAPFAWADGANDVSTEAGDEVATEAPSELSAEEREVPLSGYRWRPANPMPELHVEHPRSRTTSTLFVFLGLLVIAAAAYYGYRNDSFAPAIAWLDSTPAYQALERWSAGGGGGDRGAETHTTAAASDTGSDRSTPSPPVTDSPPAQAPAAPAMPVAETSDSEVTTPPAQLPAQSSAATAQSSPAPDDAASTNAAARCSDAATALGLCNLDKSSAGK